MELRCAAMPNIQEVMNEDKGKFSTLHTPVGCEVSGPTEYITEEGPMPTLKIEDGGLHYFDSKSWEIAVSPRWTPYISHAVLTSQNKVTTTIYNRETQP